MKPMTSASGEIICAPLGRFRDAGWSSLKWRVVGMTDTPIEIFHSVPEEDEALLIPAERGDHMAAAILLGAMQTGRHLHIEGDVSPTLLEGLARMQLVWERWSKGKYQRIDVTAMAESEAPTAVDDGAVFCMSGGVDGTFSFFRHLARSHGRISRRPKGALVVHGFDIGLEQPVYFENASRDVEKMIAGSGAKLVRMRTNSRSLPQDWEESHGLQLTGCLLALQPGFRFGMIGSGNTYDELNIWGSNPIADPLGSTEAMRIEHDGAEFNRAQKVDWIGRNTVASNLLRVCWEGERSDSNCGRCEKCVRTMMNFWANGLPIPDSFPSSLSLDSLKVIKPWDGLAIRNLRRNIVVAVRHLPSDDALLKAAIKSLCRAEMRLALGEAKRKILAFLKRRI